MITMTNEQHEKIKVLDQLFGAMDLEQLKEFTSSEKVVAILKGTNQNPEILKNLLQEHSEYMMKISSLQADLMTLRSDIQVLIKLVLKPYDYSSQGDANMLKSKYAIY